jgi:hypothetical protein
VEKYRRAGQATDDDMAHAHCMLEIKGYKHTLTEYVILIAFSAATMLARTRLNVILQYTACLVLFSLTVYSSTIFK